VQNQGTEVARSGRENVALSMKTYAAGRLAGRTQEDSARQAGVPRSTARYRVARSARIDASDVVVAFGESPEGVALLHRLAVVLVVVIVFHVGGGVRAVSMVMELSGLSPFVACSTGTMHGFVARIEELMGEFGRDERLRLGERMPRKKISLIEDETFHPDICLVAIDAVSNFILAELYAERRDAETWNATTKKALSGLPVEVVQSVSDGAAALIAHAGALGAHHSPDVFHVQHEASGAVSLPLMHQETHAGRDVESAQKALAEVREERAAYAAKEHGPGRPPTFDKRELEAAAQLETAQNIAEQATNRRSRARLALRGIGKDYHPVVLQTGVRRSAEQLTAALTGHFDALDAIAAEAGLPERSLKGLAKARRQLDGMVATLTFFHEQVDQRLDALALPAVQAHTMRAHLLPAAYLERAALRAQHADDKYELLDRADACRIVGLGVLTSLHVTDRDCTTLLREAGALADLFQRASSAVEGRNGQLSLRHHQLHLLSDARLEALTVMHNYFVRRADGSTAAERFFGEPPRDLVDFLMTATTTLPRPAQRRPRTTRTGPALRRRPVTRCAATRPLAER
jgi:hypothetical protein